MDTSALLRDARRRAELTQSEVAQRARTAQSAVAAYETGARVPSLSTLTRLFRACEHDFDLVLRPRIRRGAASVSELAQAIAADLAAGDEQGAIRLLFGFADDFRGSSRLGQASLIAHEPLPTGDPRFDAALAAIAEFFGAEAELPAPDWVDRSGRFVEPWWFIASRPAFHAYTLAHTPALFARHGVFVAREVFDRV